ncbi:iron-containing alcohol dehydrogenase [Streptomyces canarius]
MTSRIASLGVLRQPRTVLFGPGERRHLPRLLAETGRHVLVVTDARMAQATEFKDMMTAIEAQGITVSVFSGAEPDLPRENVVTVVDRYGDTGVDALLAVGGGSCLDLAKVSAVVLAHGGDVRDYYGEFLVPGPGLPVITVPTTAGTGAEVTCVSVVFDREKGMKVGVASPHLEAYAAVIDPELTLSCPPALTAATAAVTRPDPPGRDVHRPRQGGDAGLPGRGVTSTSARNPLTDDPCRSGRDPWWTPPWRTWSPAPSPTAAATLRGHAGRSYNARHGHQHRQVPPRRTPSSPRSAAARAHTPHGFGVGALLPYVMRFNLPSRIAEFAEIGTPGSGVADPESAPLDQAKAGVLRVEALLETVGCPTDHEDASGWTRSDFSYVAGQAMLATATANNPRELTARGPSSMIAAAGSRRRP